MDVDEDGSSLDESKEDEWINNDGNKGTSAIENNPSATASKYPYRTSRTVAGANAARSLDGIG